MKKLILILSLIVSSYSLAVEIVPDLQQSSPDLEWYSIQNDSVKLIYPDYLQGESVYIANLVEHYSKFVGQTMGIKKPKLFNLIIRPEMAQPNGFVTLAPRRSEWFSSSMFMPAIGSTEWYQTLSIHEYRHVNQFDHFKRRGTKVLYFLMGDFGIQLAAAMTLPSWYFEGDAVWAETKYTDGGRGRSPRFTARLKALVLSEEIPTYDQFLSGSYRTSLPNQYVYGYALVSYAAQKFGDDVWSKIAIEVSKVPIPLRLYRAFRNVTGQNFDEFYLEAMNDLRKKWAADMPQGEAKVDYRVHAAPYKVGGALYFIKQTLDTYPTLYRQEDGKTEKIAEISYSMDMTGLDIGKDKAVYTEFLPDMRYQYKGSSELVLLDLQSGKKTKLTDGQRLYNPRFNKDQTKIIAIDFKKDQTWNLSEFDLQGQMLQTFRIPDSKVAEAYYWDDTTAVVLLENKTGHKSIVMVDLKGQTVTKSIVPPSRNLLHAVTVDAKKNILFEAQYQGHNEIFKFDGTKLARCTQSRLGAYTPSSDGENLLYSNQDTYGSTIAVSALSTCSAFEMTNLVDFKYLGNNPSDNYNGFKPQEFPDQAELFTKNADKYRPQEYGDFDSQLFIPHTWGLDLGRGGGLGVYTDNYLHTLGLSASLGSSAEERESFFQVNFDVKKYYPILRLQVENRNRKIKSYSTSDELMWEERTAGLGVLLPYVKRKNLWNLAATTTLRGGYTNAGMFKLNDVETNTSTFFYKTSAAARFVISKDAKPRSIIVPWALSYQIRHDNADEPASAAANSYRVLQNAALQVPSLFANDGFIFGYDEQNQNASLGSYRFLPEATAISYVFSRGYDYKEVPFFQKAYGEYVFPVAYPDWNIGGWYYLKRIYAKGFFDSTFVKDVLVTETLNSYGAEVYLESKVLRFIPITFGARAVQRLQDNVVLGEAFLGSSVGF